MEIEYAYSFIKNVFYSDLAFLRFSLWAIPFALIFSFITGEKFFKKPVIVVFILIGLFYWESSVLNDRISKIYYDKDLVRLHQKSGSVVSIVPKDIERFWSITHGRGGTCHLMIKTEADKFHSFIVNRGEYNCGKDARLLNKFFRKS